jgi:hypothetical protein
MEKNLLRFLGTAFLLLHSKAMPANVGSSQKVLAKSEKKQGSVARQDEETKFQTFTGTIVESGDTFTLNDVMNKVVHELDDTQKARPFEGDRVNIKGTLDPTRKLIRVQAIEEAT